MLEQLLIRLGECALLAVGVSIFFYVLKRKTPFKKIPHIVQEIIIGIAFGCVAVFGTETGVNFNGATINARDAGPLCAGLMFGPWAGIIAGVIGAVERWFASLWGAGMYSRLACTIGTLFAGLYAAWMRVFLFNNRRPRAVFGAVAAMVTEAVHLLIMFLTHLDDPGQAMKILDICIVPMMVANSLAVGITMLAIDLLSLRFRKGAERVPTLQQKVQTPLLIAFIICYILTTTFIYAVQTNSAVKTCSEQLETGVEDVIDLLDRETETRARRIGENLADNENIYSMSFIKNEALSSDITEIHLFARDGNLIGTSYDSKEAFKITSTKLGKEVLSRVKNMTGKSFITEFSHYSITNNDCPSGIRYVVAPTKHGDIVIVGFDNEALGNLITEEELEAYTSSRHAGADGFFIIANENGKILSIPKSVSSLTGEEWKYQSLASFGITSDEMGVSKKMFTADRRDGTMYHGYYDVNGVYTVIALVSEDDVYSTRNNVTHFNSLMEIIVFAVLYTMVFFMIKKYIISRLKKVNGNLSVITSGDLDEKVEEKSTVEFAELSDSINSTVDTLKGYIAAESARIAKDLAMATTIQRSALPQNFATDKNYEIHASMRPAREVGGDFYDFYLLGENKLVILVADVSGKGLPAAMFMMQAKMIIKGLVESGHKIEEAFTLANEELCENNEAEMFVTSWMGVLDLETGHLDFVNAGHNPPVLRRNGGMFEYLKTPAGFVLAGMDGVRYKARSLELGKGDVLFLYTDGVTEATSLDNELYGEDRLVSYLNQHGGESCESILTGVKKDIDRFVGEADQFDDITMLAIRYM